MAKICLQLIPYGGVYGATVTSIVGEIFAAGRRGHELAAIGLDRDLIGDHAANLGARHNISFARTDGDSLLPRRRSCALTEFMASGADAVVTIDHDIQWRPGNVMEVAERAIELDAIVGGLYSKRLDGKGWGSRLTPGHGEIKIPSDRVIEADYVGSGFMAIPKSVVRRMIERASECRLTLCYNGETDFWDFYQTFNVPHPTKTDRCEFLSEDWAFCARARMVGVKSYIDCRPYLVHYGDRGFGPGDGAPKAKGK